MGLFQEKILNYFGIALSEMYFFLTRRVHFINFIIILSLQEDIDHKMIDREKIERVNTGMALEEIYLKQKNSFLSVEGENLANPERLLQALKKRNELYSQIRNPQQLPPVPEPITNLIRQASKHLKSRTYQTQRQAQIEQLDREWHSELPWQKFAFANQEQYTDQHQQFLIHNMIDSSFKGKCDIQRQIKRALFNNLKGIKDNETFSPPSRIRSYVRIQSDQKTNKEKYLEFIQRKVRAYGQNVMSIDEFGSLSGEIAHVWRVLSEHFKSYDYALRQEKSNPSLAIVNCSISLIEAQFRQLLPSLDNQREISSAMKKYVQSSRNNIYEMNTEGVLIWSIPYAYYRAGALSNFSIALSNRGRDGLVLRDEFSKFQDSLAAQEPTAQYFSQSPINDIFYNQLVAIVKGLSVYDERLCKIGQLDFVWLVLKTLKIYQRFNLTKKEEFKQAIEALLSYFMFNQDKFQTKQQYIKPYLQFLYLGSYSSMIALKNKQRRDEGLSNDDYVHILLSLYERPEIMSRDEFQCVSEELQSVLITYLSTLARQNQFKKYLMYYILQIPAESFKKVIMEVFNSFQLFSRVNQYFQDGLQGWKYIKFRYNLESPTHQQIFQQSMASLLNNLLQLEQNPEIQIKLIYQSKDLLSEAQHYIDLLIECQCHHLLNIHRLKQEKELSYSLLDQARLKKENKVIYRKLRHLLNELFQSNYELGASYGGIFNFLEDYCELQDIMEGKNLQKLEGFIKEKKDEVISDLYLLSSESENVVKDMYRKLEKFKSTELFFIYLKNIVYGNENISYNRVTTQSLQDSKSLILKGLQKIQDRKEFKIEGYKKYFNF